jgi:hypothetical protein
MESLDTRVVCNLEIKHNIVKTNPNYMSGISFGNQCNKLYIINILYILSAYKYCIVY